MKLTLKRGSSYGPSLYGGFELLKILSRGFMVLSLDLLLQHELQVFPCWSFGLLSHSLNVFKEFYFFPSLYNLGLFLFG